MFTMSTLNTVMRFREFLVKNPIKPQFNPIEIFAMYSQEPRMNTEEILGKTGLTRRQLYDIVHEYGGPNRIMTNHHTVLNMANQGMSVEDIASATHYTSRNVRYILRNKLTENDSYS